ncbi:MAG: N-acetylmuramoyl-L-alanine amidase [Eubacteriales bacterium]|nr:N-acetylmuramoyl-L-alanine amidase [Eubacteriales bacterium]
MGKVTRIISVGMMLTVLSAIILAGCGNRHSGKTGLNKSDIAETLSQTSESEKDSQMNSQSEDNTDTEITDAETEDSGVPVYEDMEHIYMNTTWEYADHSAISDGYAVLYKAAGERKNIIIGVNAGHGTAGGSSARTLCHPDGSPKSTGGSTAAGATTATAVSGGMTFYDGTPESEVTFRMAQILRDKLLSQGYDVLMVRDGADVQLDNVARTVICNNVADCHISLHWDGDGLSYDKGCFYIAVPDAIKDMEPVATHWQQHNALGASLVNGLGDVGMKIHGSGSMAIDLTQTSYSTIPSVDMELGNASSDHSDETLENIADGLMAGINAYYGY